MRTMKTLAIAAFAASALALAGCGGGGSSSSGEPPAPPAPKTVSLPDNIPAGMAPSGTHEIAAGETATSNGVTFTCAAGGEACMVMVAADGTAATYTGGMVTASLSQAAQTAIDNANKVSDADKKAMDDAAKERSATAKALKAAIDTPATSDGSTAIAVTPTSIPAIDLDGAGTGTDTSALLNLKKGASVGSLGSWSGTDYAGEAGTGTGKTTGMTRVYSNQEAAKSRSFTSEAGEAVHGLEHATTEVKGDYALSGTDATTDPDVSSEIGGFPTTGQESYDEDDTVTGTYMGAAGTYKCVAATGCTSNAEGAAGIDLSGGWTFTPSPTAMVLMKDASYLQFGWWVRKDKDGPTHAGVFYRDASATALTAHDGSADIIGKATYAGSAAGKFAVSDPLRPSNDNAGHFTADAELMADFKGATAGTALSGTIDNFRLNDGSDNPGWSIALQKPATDVTNGQFGRASAGTVWSIGGAKTAAAGSWEARMYDDKPAASSPNNTPDSVVGSFSSSIGSTHSLVGAFGAERQQ